MLVTVSVIECLYFYFPGSHVSVICAVLIYKRNLRQKEGI